MSQNRYEVLGKIADGGLGSVFKAYDRNLRREVALKRVRAESPEQAEQQAEQLMDEARNLSALQHPHIVTIYDVGRDEEGAYIIMELLKGETLENIIERGALSENDFRELVTQSLEGLVAAHSHETQSQPESMSLVDVRTSTPIHKAQSTFFWDSQLRLVYRSISMQTKTFAAHHVTSNISQK